MASKAERAIILIEQIEEDTRKRAIQDMVDELKDLLKDPTNSGEYLDTAAGGIQSAIDFITSNYIA